MKPLFRVSHRLFVGCLSLVVGIVVFALAVATVVQWRQAEFVESAARLKDDSLTVMTFSVEREIWRFNAAMQPHQAGALAADEELALRFDILLSRIALLRNNPTVARLYKSDEYRDLMPKLEHWVYRATPLVDQKKWHDRAWPPLMRELSVLAQDAQALTAASDGMTSRLAQEQVAMVHQQSRWIAWLAATQMGALLLSAAGLLLYLRRQREARAAQKRLNEALVEANVQAEAANHYKSQFLANMSHELRTPFNGILGMLTLLEKTPLTAHQHDLIQTAQNSAEHLLRLLHDLLEVSALEAGQVHVRPEAADMLTVIREVHRAVDVLAGQKGLKFVLSCETKPPVWVSVDVTRLRQILFNVLGNAVKYTERGGIELHVRPHDTGDQIDWVIDIQDTGIGMSPETLLRLFERFYLGDPSLTRKQAGSGLGLEISRSLARLMGGDLTVTSTLGRGSNFRLTLSTPVVPAVLPLKGESGLDDIPVKPLHVLVAEDHPINRKVVGLLLQSMGHRVSFAEDGLQALDQARDHDFDLILMDIHMPVMDGLASTRQIRALVGPRASVPIVALTADVMHAAVEQALAVGMNSFLSKPLQRKQLEAVLSRNWTQSGAQPGGASTNLSQVKSECG
jgi:two-component system, sensor histidine kinase